MDYTQKSRYLSLILRHKPEEANIELDVHGWANVVDILKALNISREELDINIVQADSKQRYSFNQDGTMIRANQGHSIPVELDLKERKPPDILYHGTGKKYIESIEKEGIIKKSRNYIHLSRDMETAITVGTRHGIPVVLFIQSGKMYESGYKFYLSENGIWLTEHIPLEYIFEG